MFAIKLKPKMSYSNGGGLIYRDDAGLHVGNGWLDVAKLC